MATKAVKKSLEEILIEKGVLPNEKIGSCLAEARKTGETLRQVLLRLKLITEGKLMPYVAQSLGVPYVDISNYEIKPAIEGFSGYTRAVTTEYVSGDNFKEISPSRRIF